MNFPLVFMSLSSLSHILENEMWDCVLDHKLRRLCFKPSTCKNFFVLVFPLLRLRVHFPAILVVKLSPNVTLLTLTSCKVRKLLSSLIMWLEHPLLTYH
jgi:hypothetical protein